jgi:benzoyl-CoA 2,3-dioxygenase component B
VSSNEASSFATGLKGRPDEAQYDDHRCVDTAFALEVPDANGVRVEQVPMRNAMNEVLRTSYIRDCELGLRRWNRQLERAGFDTRIELPSSRFNRAIGVWAATPCSPSGHAIDAEAFAQQREDWLPSADDRAFVASLMQRVIEPGRMAAWIAPPERGINNLAVDYEYVRL